MGRPSTAYISAENPARFWLRVAKTRRSMCGQSARQTPSWCDAQIAHASRTLSFEPVPLTCLFAPFAQSLAGHTSSVECVSFDSNEQTVIAGSAGGTLKLWDLEHAKVARTLTGHRSNCISVQVRWQMALAYPRICLLQVLPRATSTVASVRGIFRIWLCRHESENLGHPPQVMHTDVQRA